MNIKKYQLLNRLLLVASAASWSFGYQRDVARTRRWCEERDQVCGRTTIRQTVEPICCV